MLSDEDESASDKHEFHPGSLCSICTICEVKSGHNTGGRLYSAYIHLLQMSGRIQINLGTFLSPLPLQHCSGTCTQCPCEEGDQSDHCERCDVSMAEIRGTSCKFSLKTQPPDVNLFLPFQECSSCYLCPILCDTVCTAGKRSRCTDSMFATCIFPHLPNSCAPFLSRRCGR